MENCKIFLFTSQWKAPIRKISMIRKMAILDAKLQEKPNKATRPTAKGELNLTLNKAYKSPSEERQKVEVGRHDSVNIEKDSIVMLSN